MSDIAYRMADVQKIVGINRERQKALCEDEKQFGSVIPITKGIHPEATGPVLGYTRRDFLRLLTRAGWQRIEQSDVGKIAENVRDLP